MNDKRKLLILISSTVLVLSLFFGSILYNSSKGDRIDSLPEDGIGFDVSVKRAQIKNGGELIAAVRDLDAYDAIGEDLYTFGKTAYQEYASEEFPVIGFEINNFELEENNLRFEGRYGAATNKIVVTITLLKNSRYTISITDTETELNIDQYLESNSTRNSYIGTLPDEGDGYLIEYSDSEEAFFVYVYNDPENYGRAIEQIKIGLEKDSLDDEKILQIGAVPNDIDNGF